MHICFRRGYFAAVKACNKMLAYKALSARWMLG